MDGLIRTQFLFATEPFGALLYGYLTLKTVRSRSSKGPEGVHGTAHFADEEEVIKTGLLTLPGEESSGVYVGAWTDKKGKTHYLRHDGPEHIAAIAPTRSGKGVGLVIPTLLSWPHSTVIHDMKGELWNLTAGYRKKGLNNVVLKFDPAAATGSCKFNPLAEVQVGKDSEVAEVQNLVTIIVDPDGKGLNDHWTKTAHAFLTGVTLYLLHKFRNENKKTATLTDVAFALSDPSRDVKDLYEDMRTAEIKQIDESDPKNPGHKKKIVHSVVAAAGRDMLNRPEQERGSVLSTAMSYLSLYRDNLVAANISESDFQIRDLMHSGRSISLYLVVRPADKDRLKPLMRLILNQIVRTLTADPIQFHEGRPAPKYRHRLLLMLDEFPSFGRLEVFQEALAFIAGYGIKAYLIMQDITQLHAAYTVNESIISNCHIRLAYAPNNPKTAEWLSKMLGQTTQVWKSATVSGKRMGGMLKNVSESYQTTARPLMTPDEVMRLKAPRKNKKGDIVESGEMLIFVSGQTPVKGTQILYFQEPFFLEASKIAAPLVSDTLKKAEQQHIVNPAPQILSGINDVNEPSFSNEAEPKPEEKVMAGGHP
jgi:type IV secretion system protein VirD4